MTLHLSRGYLMKASTVLVVLLVAAACPAAQWYPGIVHAHTTFSDGSKSPAELAAIVQAELRKCRTDGKGFMIVTDHFDGISDGGTEAFSAYPGAVKDTSVAGEFVAIPGLEVGSKWHPETKPVETTADSHMLAIGALPPDYTRLSGCYNRNTGEGHPLLEKTDYQQKVIEQVLALGMLPLAAHPSQLLIGGTTRTRTDNRFDMRSGYAGLRGVEVFNVLSPKPEEQNDEAINFYLRLVAAGSPVFVTSGSDYHGTTLSTVPELALGSLGRITWVYADDLTPEAILRGIADGKTYAAQGGAWFMDFVCDGGQRPGSSVVGVDAPLICAMATAKADAATMVVYRDGLEVCRQRMEGSPCWLTGYEGKYGQGWLDPDVGTSGPHTYVIRVVATRDGKQETVLVTSPIRIRMRKPGETAAFFDALKAGSIPTVEEMLREDPSLANSRDHQHNYQLPVHSGQPLALEVACAIGTEETVRTLLEHGADPNCSLGAGEAGPMMEVAYSGNVRVCALMLQHGADVNRSGDGNTPLVWAIGCGHPELAKFMIEHGADIDHPGDSGRRPLKIARQMNLQDIVNILVARGAKE